MDKADKGVSRRRFLHTAGTSVVGVAAVVSGAASGATPAVARKVPGRDYDVVVVGGGFAGVTAARDCRKNGYKTLLLEARDRLGGRTFTSQFAGHHVELGGTWIHWSQPYVWSEKERYGLQVMGIPDGLDTNVDTTVVVANGERKVFNAEEIVPVAEALDKYFADASETWPRPFDAKFAWNELLTRDHLSARDKLNKLELTPIQRGALDGFLAAYGHCDINNVSYNEVARWWTLPGSNLFAANESLVRYTFKDGTISLINAMMEDGKPELQLATPVKRIEDKGDHVVITTQKGQQITAGAVVVALPMNVVHNVEFAPPLDSKVIEAAKEKHAGAGVKVFIKTKGKAAYVGRFMGLGDSAQPMSVVLTYAKAEDHTIYAAFGSDPNRLSATDKGGVQTALRAYLPDAEVIECFGHEWTTDPYSRGTYCSYKPNWYGKYYDHFEKDRGRVFFGQGDHGEGWRGFIDGAIGAGGRAARRVKKMLG